MDKKKLVLAISQLIKNEVARQLLEQKAAIILEVASMLDYNKKQLLGEISKTSSDNNSEPVGLNDFEKSLKNLRSMDTRRDVADRIAAPRRSTIRYTDNDMLNDILSETEPLREDKVSGPSVLDMVGGGSVSFTNPMTTANTLITDDDYVDVDVVSGGGDTMVGLDMKPVDLNDKNVQKTIDAMFKNVNYADKLRAMDESAKKFRENNF